MNNSQVSVFMVAAVCVVMTSGCQSEQAAPSLFTRELSLRRDKLHPGVFQDFQPQPNRRFTRCLVEQVVFLPSDVAHDPQKADEISAQMRRELVARLTAEFEVVGHSGAGVLRIQPAIIFAKLGPGYDLSNAHLEVLMTDSVTGEHVMALADTRPHTQTSAGSLFSDWENARAVLEAWGALVHDKAAYVHRP